jgi:hypothetical protein
LNYYLLSTLGHANTQYCFISNDPDDLGKRSYKITRGYELAEADAPLPLRVHMADDHPGMELSDRMSNACNLLIVSSVLQKALADTNRGPAQYLPLQIYNHKKRLASDDYFVVNPLGTVDVLNLKASTIKWFEDDVVSVDKMVLDPKKLESAPDLFRVKENPYTYVVSDRVFSAWRKITPKPTNIAYTDLEQCPAE